jgi:hypothetical protein
MFADVTKVRNKRPRLLDPVDEGITILRNVCNYLPDLTA